MISKITILCAVVVACQATGIGLVSTGVSSTTRRQDNNGNYDFGYDITDAEGASNFRRETGDADGNKQGSYGLRDTDGRSRTVDYIADKQGFRAVVKTNEPGTAFSAPAGAVIDSPYDMPKAPEPIAPAPIPEQAPIAVPAPVARPPPVAHPAPIGVAFSPVAQSHSSRVDIVHTVPAAPVHIVPMSPFTHVYPAPFIVNPVISRFGYGHSVLGGKSFIMGKH